MTHDPRSAVFCPPFSGARSMASDPSPSRQPHLASGMLLANGKAMRKTLRLASLLVLAAPSLAQQPPAAAPPRPAPAPLQVPNPHYVSIPMTIEVNAPVDKVWARIGKYCDIGEWGIPGCTILSGDGGYGTVAGEDGAAGDAPLADVAVFADAGPDLVDGGVYFNGHGDRDVVWVGHLQGRGSRARRRGGGGLLGE